MGMGRTTKRRTTKGRDSMDHRGRGIPGPGSREGGPGEGSGGDRGGRSDGGGEGGTRADGGGGGMEGGGRREEEAEAEGGAYPEVSV
jgi:hypothetical protein